MSTDSQNDLSQARELMSELVASSPTDSEIHHFARLLIAGIDAAEAGDATEEDHDTLHQCLQQAREWIESGEDGAPALLDEATERWQHLISDDALEVDTAWESGPDEISEPSGEDFDGPSAEQIQSLMQQFQQQPQADPQESTPPPSEPNQQPLELSGQQLDAAIGNLDPELREAFLEDAVDCVGSMEAALLKLESNSDDDASVQQILRELHTLKGASASVGLTALADHIHHIEDQLREDQSAGRRPDIDQLLKTADLMRRSIEGDSPVEPSDSPVTTTSPAAGTSSAPTPSFSEGPADDETVRVKSSQLNRLMDMLAELVMLRNRRETELQELQEVYHELIGSVSKMRLLSNEDRTTLHVNSSLQLSEIANDVLEVAQNVRDCARPVSEGNAAVSQFIRQFRQELVELRRTPISGLFQRLQRSVRDAAQAESKEVELRLIGEQAGIERTLQQRLYEPLLHIVRNSVCHGIETSDQRRQAGKPETGVITIEAQSGPDLLTIEICDDGRGLDYDAIRRRGIERGLLSANQAASEDELAQLIFHPGFSTRESANQVAGRGVGMDVVASTLQRMRGWLEVDSTPGQGTRIRLSFPLPSLVQHAMVFRAGGQLFALPMQSVFSAGQIDPDTLQLRMSDLLGVEPSDSHRDRCTGIVLACEATCDGNAGRVTLIVDEIVGPEEVVVRPLPSLLKQHPFCSGATLSGLAKTVLLLDPRRIVETQSHLLRKWDQADYPQPTATETSRPLVLVADDSLSARRRVVRSLSRYPVDIVEVSDGQQAFQKLQSQRFAAVFSDMEMPHMSGMDLLAAARERTEQPAPPIVIISSRNEPEFTDRAGELGACDYLFKPLSDEALDQALWGIESLQHLVNQTYTSLPTSGATA